jgi:hypothetical protein
MKDFNLLEIGVSRGRSLKVWKEYFPNAKIYGIERKWLRAYDEDRIKVFRGNQGDTRFLGKVAKRIGPMEIIIDDAAHIGRLQKISFECLFPHLNPGGIYAIEDIHTAFMPEWEGGRGVPGTIMEYLKNLMDDMVDNSTDSNGVSFINIYPDVVVIGKEK